MRGGCYPLISGDFDTFLGEDKTFTGYSFYCLFMTANSDLIIFLYLMVVLAAGRAVL